MEQALEDNKQDRVLDLLQDLIDEFGGADNALREANKTAAPRKLRRASKFLKRSLRIMARVDRGLPIYAKKG